MEIVVVICLGLACAVVGSWEVAKHKHHRRKLPEDIQ
jgi:NADH:ubiquinone oxidoreductase subunit E